MGLLWFILLIGGLIAVHELGHFVAAKLVDVKVLKISIGFGPSLWSRRIGGTEVSLSCIPLGGYVRLLGENREVIADSDRGRAFHHKPSWQRLFVILAGPMANLLLPLFIFTSIYARKAHSPSSTLGHVLEGQPAAEAGLKAGDRVVAINDEPVREWSEVNRIVSESPGIELRMTLSRPGLEGPARTITKYVTPREHLRIDPLGFSEHIGMIGVAPNYRLPQVGILDEQSPAYLAGLRNFDSVLSIQGRPVNHSDDLEPLTQPKQGGMVTVSYLRPEPVGWGFISLGTLQPHASQLVPSVLPVNEHDRLSGRQPKYETGLRPADLFVERVAPGSVAAEIGLVSGAFLMRLDGSAVRSWEELSQILGEHPEKSHRLTWQAQGQIRDSEFRLEKKHFIDAYQSESTMYVLGAEGSHATLPVAEVELDRQPARVLAQAAARVLSVTGTMLRVLGQALIGKISPTTIGGPILIYEVAGVAAQHGFDEFLAMAALVSLNLGLLNLLPVPLLDGGQAMFVLLEWLRRRPVTLRARERAGYVGLGLLVALMLVASLNDLVRHFPR